MGSTISAMCKQVGETPVVLTDGFYEHQRNILQSRGYKSAYDLYQDLENQKKRDQKIEIW